MGFTLTGGDRVRKLCEGLVIMCCRRRVRWLTMGPKYRNIERRAGRSRDVEDIHSQIIRRYRADSLEFFGVTISRIKTSMEISRGQQGFC